jgi:predicted O-methyltransferase YrrM
MTWCGENMKYWLGAARRLGANLLGDLFRKNGSRFEFTRQWLSAGYAYDNRPKLPSRHFLDLYPVAESQSVNLEKVAFRRSNATPLELYCMSCVAELRQPKRIFEIWTFDGATTLRLARSVASAEVFTLDLDPQSAIVDGLAVIDSEVNNIKEGGIGFQFAGKSEASRITQLLGDSTRFDYAPYAGTCDLVFVDACHDYEFVKSDSQAALNLLRPGGVILWHDYVPGWPGVVRALDELLPSYPLVHIAGTALAVLDQQIGS